MIRAKCLVMLCLCTTTSLAKAEYSSVYAGDFSTAAVVDDFIYTQLGTIGSPTGTHAQLTFTNQALRVSGRQANKPAVRLKNIAVTNSLKINFSFRLFNTVTTETFVALGWRMRTNATANTYPLYYLALDRNPTNGAMSSLQLIKKWEYASTAQRVLARYDYVPTGEINSNTFTWNITSEITKTNQFGDTLAIQVTVTNGGTEFCTLTVHEPALERSGSNWTFTSSIHAGIGLVAGPLPNNGTFKGVDVLALDVSENPVPPVVEPELSLTGIGNSFTYYNNHYPYIFNDLAAVGQRAVRTGSRAFSGRTLKAHCTEINDGSTTPAWIATNAYDYYVINELSLNTIHTQGIFYTSWRTNEFATYADVLIKTIQTNHPAARIFFYESWAPKTNIMAMSGLNSQPELTTFYTNFANGYSNVEIMPFGRAMQRVHQQHANPYPPVLSGDDSEHPAPAGTYLLACVVYSRMFNQSPEGLPYFKDTGLTTAINLTNRNYAGFLQRIGYDTYKRTTFTNPPHVEVTIPDRAPPLTDVSFRVTATDNGTITNYSWSFGDGTSVSGPGLTDVTHQYATNVSGIDVYVTVQDDAGEWERWGRWVALSTNAQIISGFLATNGSVFVTNDVVGLSATASSGLPVDFTIASGPASLLGTNLSFTGTGTVKVVAFQAGNGSWLAASSVTNTYTVTGAGEETPEELFINWLRNAQGQDPDDPNFAHDEDFDQDGTTTWAEFLADTDPAASGSVFRIDAVYNKDANRLSLTFPASSNRFYQMVEFSNLLFPGVFTDLGRGTPGMVVTNVPGHEAATAWGFRALLVP